MLEGTRHSCCAPATLIARRGTHLSTGVVKEAAVDGEAFAGIAVYPWHKHTHRTAVQVSVLMDPRQQQTSSVRHTECKGCPREGHTSAAATAAVILGED